MWVVVLLQTPAAVNHTSGALMSRDDLNSMTGKQSAGPSNCAAGGRVVPAAGRPGHGEFTASLRRQRVSPGRLEDGYTGAFEVICGDCGDHPDLGYSQVSPRLQRLRGPYHTIKAGLAAYQEHLGLAELAAGAVRPSGADPALRGVSNRVWERMAPARFRKSGPWPQPGAGRHPQG
jgi:hypothetical protein